MRPPPPAPSVERAESQKSHLLVLGPPWWASVLKGSAGRVLTSPNMPLPVSQGALGHLLPLCNEISSTVPASAPLLSCPHGLCLFQGPIPRTQACSSRVAVCGSASPGFLTRTEHPNTSWARGPSPSLCSTDCPEAGSAFDLPAGSNKRHFPCACWNIFSKFKSRTHYPTRTRVFLRTFKQNEWNWTTPGRMVARHMPHGPFSPLGDAYRKCHLRLPQIHAMNVARTPTTGHWLPPAQVLPGSWAWTVVSRKPPSCFHLLHLHRDPTPMKAFPGAFNSDSLSAAVSL